MGSQVKCDCCGKTAHRHTGKVSPEGWYYMEAFDEEEDPDDTIIMYACSPECREGLWKEGPGDLDLTLPPV